jgi:hypothetical protein
VCALDTSLSQAAVPRDLSPWSAKPSAARPHSPGRVAEAVLRAVANGELEITSITPAPA